MKRRSLIEDKKALHEEEIIMHAPTDNIIKSATIPDQVVKLKSTINDDLDVSKSEFDKELQDKFKTTIKDVETFEYQPVEVEEAKIVERIDEKIQLDSAATEKPFKKNEVTFKSAIPVRIPSDDGPSKIETTKKFIEQEIIEQPFITAQEPLTTVTTTKSTRTIASTQDFLDFEQQAAQNEPNTIVTNYVVEEQNGPETVKTFVTTTTTTVNKEWTEPIEIKTIPDTDNNSYTTVQISKDVFHGDPSDTDEFYKSIEQQITKKMSQDYTMHKDDMIADGKFQLKFSMFKKIDDNIMLNYSNSIR